jgi:hypothetical protein
MNKLALAAIVLFAATVCAFAQTEKEVRAKVVGTWKMVSYENTLKDGTKRQVYGPHARGFLMYQPNGYMCADLENPDRGPKWADTDHVTAAEAEAAGRWTFAYCGRYEVDAKNNRLIHLPEVATDPGYVDSRQIRPYKFEGNRMILGDAVTGDPEVVRWTIIWEKVSDTR